jgi:FkbM family methyltransferase
MHSINNKRLIIQTIVKIQSELELLGIKSYLIDGALLGLIREKTILDWDWDCEIAFIDNFTNINDFVKVIPILTKIGLDIKSVNTGKYLKINCTNKEVDNYNFSIIGLVPNKNYFIRPRFKYLTNFFEGENHYTSNFGRIRIPRNPEKFLDFVYKNWKTPVIAKNNRDYLNRHVYRYNYISDIFLRLIYKLFMMLDLLSRIILSDKLNGRESLYKLQLRSLATNHTQFLQIGSSNTDELNIILRCAKKIDKLVIIEPQPESYEQLEKTLLSGAKGYKKLNFSLINGAVVKSDYDKNQIELFYPHGNSNLTAISKIHGNLSIVAKAYKLNELLKQFDLDLPILICMDIEGQEVDLLADDYFHNFKQISLLFELHQREYIGTDITEVCINLSQGGFLFKYIESSAYYDLDYFKSLNFDKVLRVGRRTLYRVLDHNFDLLPLFRDHPHSIPIYPYFNYRLARSVTISKNINTKIFKLGSFSLFCNTIKNFAVDLIIGFKLLFLNRKIGSKY